MTYSLRHILWAGFSILVALPLVITSVLLSVTIVPKLSTQVAADNLNLSNAISSQIENHLGDKANEIERLGGQFQVLAENKSSQELILNSFLKNEADIEAIYVLNTDLRAIEVGLPDGHRLSRDDLIWLDFSNRNFVKDAAVTKKISWSNSYLSSRGNIVVAVAVPIGEHIFIGEIDLKNLSAMVKRMGEQNRVLAVIADSQGHLVAHPHIERGQLQENWQEFRRLKSTLGDNRIITSEFSIDNKIHVGTIAKIPELGWMTLVAKPKDDAFESFHNTVYVIAFVILLSLGIALLAAIGVARFFVNQLNDFGRHIKLLATGHFAERLPRYRIIEINDLSDDIQRMSDAVLERENLLRLSEAQYREVVETTEELITRVNGKGHITFVNHMSSRFFGMNPDECIGLLAFDFVHPEDRQNTINAFDAWRDTDKKSLNFENRQISLSGSIHRMQWIIIPERDQMGEIKGFSGFARDVTEQRQAEEALSYSLSLTNATLESTPDGILIVNLDGRISRWNKRFVELWKVPEHLLDTTVDDPVISHVAAQMADPDMFLAKVMELMERYEDSSFDLLHLADGRVVERYSQPHRVGEVIVGRFWSFRDVTERKLAEVALQKSEANYRILFREMLDGFAHHQIICDADGNPVDYLFLAVNPAFTRMTNFTQEELVGRTVLEVLPNTERHWIEAYGKVALIGEPIFFEEYSIELNKHFRVTAYQPSQNQFACIVADITERRQSEEKINQLAFFDQLTGLPNRTLLHDRIRQAMAASTRSGNYCALLLIDLDNFKMLNDTLGHEMGDLLLKEVAQRLTASVRAEDTVARLGGDEFVVILAGLSQTQTEAANQIEIVGEKIHATLNRTYYLRDISYQITPSIGASLFVGDTIEIDTLIKQSDLAMYRAKDAGRNTFRFFDPDMELAVINRAKLESELREAINQEQFVLHYQPQITGTRIIGCEALVRWQHPQRGMVSPNEFIPLAEESGMILQLGNWVMETACRQIALWATEPEMAHLTVAVNVSIYQFRQTDFVDQVLRILRNTGANPNQLKLELTETILASDIDDVVEKMFTLKAKGVGFSLDDFGTGYSSLSYLKRLPFEQLKIDQSFVRDVLIDQNDAAIAMTIIALAQSMSLSVIAEGVETSTQRDFLASAGCHAYQGYYFSRPLPVNLFEEFCLMRNEKPSEIP